MAFKRKPETLADRNLSETKQHKITSCETETHIDTDSRLCHGRKAELPNEYMETILDGQMLGADCFNFEADTCELSL